MAMNLLCEYVQAGELAMQANSGRVVSLRGGVFIGEEAKIVARMIALDRRLPQTPRPVPSDALEARRQPSCRPTVFVARILRLRAGTQVLTPVVQRVAVDVIDLDAQIRHAEYCAMHGDGRPNSVVAPRMTDGVHAPATICARAPTVRRECGVVGSVYGCDAPIAQRDLHAGVYIVPPTSSPSIRRSIA